jgi:hypothetical protein
VTTGPGQPVVIDATVGASGGPFTGVVIVAPPSATAGDVAVQRTSIVFTPALPFSGTTTFTFALRNGASQSAAAVVTVTVTGRPDPSKDRSVLALVTAMTDAVQHVVDAAISDVGDRLRTLNAGGGSGATVQGLLLTRGQGASGPLGAWAAGTWDTGTHDLSPLRSPTASGFRRVTAGVDYRFSPRLAAGIAGGVSHDVEALSTAHDEGAKTDASDLTAYASLRIGHEGFIDALAGTGTAAIHARRFDPIGSVQMTGARSGNDAFASLTAGRTYRTPAWTYAPYAGATATTANLHTFTEWGAELGALTYGDQLVRAVSAVVGIRGEARLGTSVGSTAPRFAVEYDRRLSGNSVAPVWYSDRPDVPFALPANQIGAHPLSVGAGAAVRLPQAFLFNVDYRAIVDQASVQHLITIGISVRR